MGLPTENVGSVPRPDYLLDAMGSGDPEAFAQAADKAVAETLEAMAATGSPIITDGEQSKPSFATYPLAGLDNLASDGVVIPFEDGHTRHSPSSPRAPSATRPIRAITSNRRASTRICRSSKR